MDRIRVLVRPAEFQLRLRKAKTAHLPKRKGHEDDLALPEGKTVVPGFPDVILREKKGSDAFGADAPGFTDLHVGHLKSIPIITEKTGFCKEKKLRAISYHFVLIGTKSCRKRLKKRKYHAKMHQSKYAFVKAVDEPLSGDRVGTALLCQQVPGRGIFMCMEEKT